jgi:hypothetical protein
VETHPPLPRFAHRLPSAPAFVGRDAELDELRRLWKADGRGVIALVGLGGAGKTAVTACFLEELFGDQANIRPDGLFVWSFYQEPDAALFLEAAYDYFQRNGAAQGSAKGAGLLHLLCDALLVGGPNLLVLDGLERVQIQGNGPQTHATAGQDLDFGQIEDPLLKGLLIRLAEGVGRTTVLITSRFPVIDLHLFKGRGYRHVDIGGLDTNAAMVLLKHRGVRGDTEQLARLVNAYGAHPLTLDHLGGLIAPKAPALTSPGKDRQALRLARLLRAYEEHLPVEELALISKLSLLRRSVTQDQFLDVFLCLPPIHLA